MRQIRPLCLLILLCAYVFATSAQATSGNVTYTYDGAGRVIATIYEDGTGQIYTYDPAGNRYTSFSGTPTVLTITPTASVNESSAITITVSRVSGTAVSTSVNYKVVDVSAVSGINYVATPPGTLMFASGDTAKTFQIATKSDSTYDGPLTFRVVLTPALASPNVALQNSSELVTINDASPAPTFAIATPASVVEGTTQMFTVTRTGTTSLNQTINYSTADGTAVSGSDYNSEANSLSFTPTTTSRTFVVPTIPRPYFEGTRSFTASIAAPANNAVISTSSATGTITDTSPTISFAVDSPVIVNAGNPITFTVSMAAGPAGAPFSVDYTFSDITAVLGTDYYFDFSANDDGPSGTLTFYPGVTSMPLVVDTYGGEADGNTRTFKVTLSNATLGVPISTAVGTGGIKSPLSNPAPTQLVATPGTQQVQLNWQGTLHNPTYSVYQGTAPGAESASAIQSGLVVNNYLVTGLTGGATYYFYVKSIYTNQVSAPSNEASATTTAPIPTGLTAAAGAEQVGLSWTSTPGAISYSVYQGTTAGGEGSTAVLSGLTGTNATVAGLADGTRYYFTLKAAYTNATSAPSSEASATPVAMPPTVNLTSSASSVGTGISFTLTWSSTNATSCTSTQSAGIGFSGAQALSGSKALIASAAEEPSALFTLSCTGSGGTLSKSVTVSVSGGGT